MKQTKDTAQFHSWTEMAKTQDLDKVSLASQSQCYAKKRKKKVEQASGTLRKARMALL